MKSSNQFARLSMANKLRRLQVLTVGLALVFTFTVVGVSEVVEQRSRILGDTFSSGTMIGFNAAAALLFEDAKSATDILAALRNKPTIVGARLYRIDGEGFADYLANGISVLLPASLAEAEFQQLRNSYFELLFYSLQPIMQNDELVGHLLMVVDLQPMWISILVNLGQISLGTLIAFLLSGFYGRKLADQIAAPLVGLSALARQVSREKNYSLRAEGGGSDELGQLIASFNGMIEQVQERDAELERQRDRLEDEVQNRTADLREALVAAQAASVAKSQFLANMSHEIRTPMNGVLGMTELLLGTELNVTQRQYAETVFQSADSLLSIINDILDFSKIEAGKMELEEIDFNLTELCERLTAMFYDQAQQNHIEIGCDIDSTVEDHLRGDPHRLRQILTNLLANAIKFTRQGSVNLQVMQLPGDGSVEREHEIELMFRISDTGIGISEQAMIRLFKAFSQGDGSTTRKYGGTGLGLVICKELCQLMGGNIAVNSVPDAGTVFRVTLPFRKALQPVPLSAGYFHNLKGKSALIVDDSPINAGIVAGYLTGFGMQCRVVDSGSEALALLEAEQFPPFDLALLDMKMHDMSGAELCREIRRQPRYAGMKVVIASSTSYDDELGRIRASGCDMHLIKPLRKGVLQSVLSQLLAEDKPVLSKMPGQLVDIRVLLVEDNPVNQKVASAMLKELGCRVETVDNGLLALDAAKRGAFDIILMDCMMPVMDGYTAAENIRTFEATSGKTPLPILALTANAMQGDREKCLTAGMNDYLAKPFQLTELRDKLTCLLALSEPEASADPQPNQSQGPTVGINFDPSPLATLRQMGGAPLVEELLSLFFSNVPPLLDKLEQALNTQDTENVRNAAHSLKSAAGNLGALSMAERSREIEHAARQGSLDGLNNTLPILRREYLELRTVLQQFAREDQQ